MSIQDIRKLEELQREVKTLEATIKREQNSCTHDWTAEKYDPTYKKEPSGFRTVAQGSDIWSEAVGYHDVEVARWSRQCRKCGKIQFANERATKVVDVGAAFKD